MDLECIFHRTIQQMPLKIFSFWKSIALKIFDPDAAYIRKDVVGGGYIPPYDICCIELLPLLHFLLRSDRSDWNIQSSWVALSCIDDVLQSKQLLWHWGPLDGAESVFLWWPSSLQERFEGIADFRSEMYSYFEYCGGLTSCLWGCQGKPPRSIHPARAIHHLLLLFLISNTIFSSTHIQNCFFFSHCVQTMRLELLRSNYRGGCLLSHVQQTLRITLNTVKAFRSKLLSWPFGMGMSAESSIKALKVSLLSGGSWYIFVGRTNFV